MDSEGPEKTRPTTGKDMYSQTLGTQTISTFVFQVKSILSKIFRSLIYTDGVILAFNIFIFCTVLIIVSYVMRGNLLFGKSCLPNFEISRTVILQLMD